MTASTRRALFMAFLLILGGCGSTAPMHGQFAWGEPHPTLQSYTRIIIDTVGIDRDAHTRSGGATAHELEQLAAFTRSEFVFFAQPYVATFPGPGVARLKLTLSGLENNVPIAATVSRAIPTGLAMNPTHGAGERPGAFTGSATLTAQLFDSETGAPLGMAVQKSYPAAMDIGATFNSHAAHEAAITEAAKGFRKWLDELHERAR
ncbi:MAG: DUF3313 domain-containing protein [Burkholderiales bacterium]